MTYDFPDCLMAQPYTPQSLCAEMKVIKDWGIERLHWIDYSDAPSFMAMDYWDRNYLTTKKACGDLLTCAAAQAHANNLEIIADFKVFDLGINTFYRDEDEQWKNYSASYDWLKEFSEFCLRSKGFQVF